MQTNTEATTENTKLLLINISPKWAGSLFALTKSLSALSATFSPGFWVCCVSPVPPSVWGRRPHCNEADGTVTLEPNRKGTIGKVDTKHFTPKKITSIGLHCVSSHEGTTQTEGQLKKICKKRKKPEATLSQHIISHTIKSIGQTLHTLANQKHNAFLSIPYDYNPQVAQKKCWSVILASQYTELHLPNCCMASESHAILTKMKLHLQNEALDL